VKQNSTAGGGKESGSTPPPAPASVRPAVVQHGSAACVQYRAGGAGVVEREQEGGRENVWEVAGSGVSLLV
jgi:hypothetical protein